jgi:hypothetical protein
MGLGLSYWNCLRIDAFEVQRKARGKVRWLYLWEFIVLCYINLG